MKKILFSIALLGLICCGEESIDSNAPKAGNTCSDTTERSCSEDNAQLLFCAKTVADPSVFEWTVAETCADNAGNGGGQTVCGATSGVAMCVKPDA